MESLTIGVDSGFSSGIGITEGRNVLIQNYIYEVPQDIAEEIAQDVDKIEENNRLNIILKYNNRYFIVGDLATDLYPDILHNVDKDRINNIYHLIEILAISGLMSKNNEFEANIVLGLPNAYKKDREKFCNWISGNFEFSYMTKNGEIKKAVSFKNTEVLPQVFAPQFILPKEQLEAINRENGIIFSVDLGHGTLDLMALRNSKPLRLSIEGSEGVKRVYKMLKDRLLHKYSTSDYKVTNYTEKKLQNILETGRYVINENRKEEDIDDILEFVLDDYAQYVYQRIENSFGDLISEGSAFVVSGGILNNNYFRSNLKSKLKENYNMGVFTHRKPQYAVAEGLHQYGINVFGGNVKKQEKIKEDIIENI